MIYTTIRCIYNSLFILGLPFIVLKKLIRSRNNKGYRQRLLERFGNTPFSLKNSIWIHSVSMGESIAIAPLVKRLAIDYPVRDFIVTTMTPTGSSQVIKLYANFTNIHHCYIPYDIAFFLKRFINKIDPKLCIIMETEIWPNLLAVCKKRHIPIILINARLSEKSAQGYAKLGFITRKMLSQIAHISTQTQDDYKRFIKLGVARDKITVDGNLKYDFTIDDGILNQAKTFRASLQNKVVWIAASTHQGEDEVVLNAHQNILKSYPNALLILIPRHPERFDQVAKLIAGQGLRYVRRTTQNQKLQNINVYLADTMGEMMLFYAASDISFVGGSFSGTGGHNMLEPAALSKPILSGPSVFNFMVVAQRLIDKGALKIVSNAHDLSYEIKMLIEQPHQADEMGIAAFKCFKENQGALNKQLTLIKRYLC
ncbi:lipid IV(A) 3-deoxy-D-manno-octulosonic acid transferase [Fastidiosibacter lacustris]|uniref:lipid IV(A) 3-deoxy-D-manno-octulosonic acid transferase n=1 Tax=Fastidiosibacter lacustris TaxID=2056695 RepID=UPI000E346044|nr:lipid IV(A) 3-deoxy-D-manno-octulosonic acid transferase [Fastidiosibacter lacustris]